MEALTTTAPVPRSRRSHRLGIDAHTEFVAVLVSELDAAVTSLLAAASHITETLSAGDVELVDPSALDRSVGDVRRLVRLLDIIDGPGEDRQLQLLSLPDALCRAAKGLDLDIAVRGAAGPGRFFGDAESVRLGAELVLSAFAACDGPVQLGSPTTTMSSSKARWT